jgi:hypothetical protein
MQSGGWESAVTAIIAGNAFVAGMRPAGFLFLNDTHGYVYRYFPARRVTDRSEQEQCRGETEVWLSGKK